MLWYETLQLCLQHTVKALSEVKPSLTKCGKNLRLVVFYQATVQSEVTLFGNPVLSKSVVKPIN